MTVQKQVELVAAILKNYADRAVFRGFSAEPIRNGRAIFKMLWHRDQFFDLILDVPKKTLRFPMVVPSVPANSPMYREFKQWIEERHSPKLLEHRRIDSRKARLKAGNRGGKASLTMTVKGNNFEYATRKLINAVHETYLVFLSDGRYYDYMVETLGLDPDKF
ncbi:MAG TPA: hypothetical protein VGV35_03235 [Bryobacteraceae bacterium]|nr:hypothetical protein [Bryobacteraceae bacterium]